MNAYLDRVIQNDRYIYSCHRVGFLVLESVRKKWLPLDIIQVFNPLLALSLAHRFANFTIHTDAKVSLLVLCDQKVGRRQVVVREKGGQSQTSSPTVQRMLEETGVSCVLRNLGIRLL